MTFPQILLIAIVACLLFLLAFLKTPQGKGKIGEARVKWVLGKTESGKKYVINDLILKTENGTSQIDHVFINQAGIFVIETKNYSGRIYGQENHLEWTQVLNYGKVKNKLYNPIKQNKTHLYHISNVLSEKISLTSAVVFVQGNIQHIKADGVYTLRGLQKLIKSKKTILNQAQMELAYQELLDAHSPSVSNVAHVKNIKRMQQNISNNLCPRCGKKLVTRNGKSGSFMGCEGYPACRFTKRL